MSELWKEIKGFEGLYEVSSFGRVRSIGHTVLFSDGRKRFYKGQIIKPRLTNAGYNQVILYKDRVDYHKHIHRLVAEAFLENKDGLRDVNHKNEDKTDNRVDNLEWVTHRENMLYGKRGKKWRETMIDRGHLNIEYSGLSKLEYRKKWWSEHKDEINRLKRERRQVV